MKNEHKRIPQFYKDGSGIERARMPLATPGTFATLDAADMRTLLAMGVSTFWCIKRDGYVAVNVPGSGPQPVARLVMGAGNTERVSYRDGDKLNLTADNLTTTRKQETRVDLAALLELQAEARKAREAAAQAKAQQTINTAAQRRARLWAELQKDDSV